MRIPFDQGTPVPLRSAFAGHTVTTAFEMGWSRLTNGELLRAADEQFDVLVTTDQHIRQQQNLDGLRLAVLVLPTTSWPRIENNVEDIVEALDRIVPGDYREISFSA